MSTSAILSNVNSASDSDNNWKIDMPSGEVPRFSWGKLSTRARWPSKEDRIIFDNANASQQYHIQSHSRNLAHHPKEKRRMFSTLV